MCNLASNISGLECFFYLVVDFYFIYFVITVSLAWAASWFLLKWYLPTYLAPSLPSPHRRLNSVPQAEGKRATAERECAHRPRKQCFRAHISSTQSAKNFCNSLALARIVSYSTSPPSQIRTHSIKNQPLGLVFKNILVFLDSRNWQESN